MSFDGAFRDSHGVSDFSDFHVGEKSQSKSFFLFGRQLLQQAMYEGPCSDPVVLIAVGELIDRFRVLRQ